MHETRQLKKDVLIEENYVLAVLCDWKRNRRLDKLSLFVANWFSRCQKCLGTS
jgi:hypothetical protein